MKPLRTPVRRPVTLVLVAGLLSALVAGPSGASNQVLPGFNLFDSVEGAFNFFGALNLGTVEFTGQGVGSFDFGSGSEYVGGTDTIVERLATATSGSPTIAIEIVALSLRSVTPVPINAGPAQYIYVTLNQDNGSQMTIGGLGSETNPHGTFSSTLDFDFDVRTAGPTGPIQGTFSKVFTATPKWKHTTTGLRILGVNFLLNGVDTSEDFHAVGLVIHDSGADKHVVGTKGDSTTGGRKFSLTGGGAQSHIGNGLALPIQFAIPQPTNPTVFPPLLIPVAVGGMGTAPVLTGTISKPLLTAMATPSGPVTKSGYQRKLNIPLGALAKGGAALVQVGVKFSNPTVFAVATNLVYAWPAAPAVFSTAAAVGTTTVASPFAGGGSLTYSNTLGARFGGPAAFAISAGPPLGLFPASPVTVYAKINTITPPCTFPMTNGMGSNCVAGILLAAPTGVGAIGGASTMIVMTPGVPITGLNVAAVKLGTAPLGTLLPGTFHTAGTAMIPFPFLAAMGAIPTNMASSQGGPWTTGQIIISAPMAGGMGEKFTLSGKDARTQSGAGTIQLVAGSVSVRFASGPNANRGWLRLTLTGIPPVPSMSPVGLMATVALILLGFGYTMRRRIFA